MAARENQGYLIAVIVLVLLVLVLGLLAFLGMSKATEHFEGITKANADKTVAEKVSDAHRIEAEILRSYVGDLGENIAEVPTKIASLGRLTNDSALNDTQKNQIRLVINRVDEVKAAYERDMKQFIARAEGETSQETWSGVLRNLNSITATKHNQLNVSRIQNTEDRDRLENEKKALQERLNENEKLLATVTENFNSEKKRNADKEQQLLADLNKAQQTIQQNSKLSEETIAELRSDNSKLKDVTSNLGNENQGLQMRISDLTRENFDLHDGIILRVGRGSDLVYINRGRKDGLRTNQTFAVYDNSITNFIKDQEKAKVEVIRITGPHTADARITDQNPVDPITKNDKIVTPTWDPGFSVPIAVAGVFDMDQDGHSDLRQFIRLVENNGGTIVARNDENGKLIGKIDTSTRYLVLGGSPKLNPTSEASASINNAIRELERQAEDKSVQVIDMRLMLNKMGRHNRASVDRFNPQASKTFRERQPSGGSSTREGSSTKGSSTREGSSTKGSSTR